VIPQHLDIFVAERAEVDRRLQVSARSADLNHMRTGDRAAHTVLIVDDSDDTRALLRVRFALDGFVVVAEATDALGAIDAARAVAPDVIVVDLVVPGVDGLTALPALRAAAPSARIVLFSWFAEPMTLHSAMAAGADTVVDKRGGAAALTSTVSSLFVADEAPVDRRELDAVQSELRTLTRRGASTMSDADRARYDALVDVEATLLARDWEGSPAR
jgi:DNA-binding NarL/FixJ family response regulator